MLSFSASLSSNSNAFALFVSENYEYKDPRNILPKDIRRKIDLFLRLLKVVHMYVSACSIIGIKNMILQRFFKIKLRLLRRLLPL